MFICKQCHVERQNRQALESQSLQWINYSYTGRLNCPDCGTITRGEQFEYLNAFELLQKLDAMKEKVKAVENAEPFTLTGYHSAQDMLERSKIFPAILKDTEAMHDVLQYAADLESIISEVRG